MPCVLSPFRVECNSHCFLNLLSIQGSSLTALRDNLLSEEEATRRHYVEEKLRYEALFEHLDFSAAFRNLKDTLPDFNDQEATQPTLLSRGGFYFEF